MCSFYPAGVCQSSVAPRFIVFFMDEGVNLPNGAFPAVETRSSLLPRPFVGEKEIVTLLLGENHVENGTPHR